MRSLTSLSEVFLLMNFGLCAEVKELSKLKRERAETGKEVKLKPGCECVMEGLREK